MTRCTFSGAHEVHVLKYDMGFGNGKFNMSWRRTCKLSLKCNLKLDGVLGYFRLGLGIVGGLED